MVMVCDNPENNPKCEKETNSLWLTKWGKLCWKCRETYREKEEAKDD